MKKKIGRPTKLTPGLQKEIAGYMRNGNYVETAAALAGLSKDTFYEWIKKGEREETGIYSEFSDAIKRAEAEAETSALEAINKAAKIGNWQAAAWRLERKHPQRWGKKPRIDPGGEKECKIYIDAEDLGA